MCAAAAWMMWMSVGLMGGILPPGDAGDIALPGVFGFGRPPRAYGQPHRPDMWHRVLAMSDMDDYLDGLPPDQRTALERVRALVAAEVPEAEAGKSYGMPAFLLGGRPLLGFRAAKRHLSVFPFSPAAVEAVEARLDGFDLAKGTIRFTPEQPVPEDVLADLVRFRMREISAQSSLRK